MLWCFWVLRFRKVSGLHSPPCRCPRDSYLRAVDLAIPNRDLAPVSAPRTDSPFSFSPGTSEMVPVWQIRRGTIHKFRYTYAPNPAPASQKYTCRTWPGAPNTNIWRPCVHPSTARKSWITCHGVYFSSWLPAEWCTTDYPANLYSISCGWKVGHKVGDWHLSFAASDRPFLELLAMALALQSALFWDTKLKNEEWCVASTMLCVLMLIG